MAQTRIHLDFDTLRLDADLFDTEVAQAFRRILPVTVPLTRWGNEYYGPIHHDLGEHRPVAKIPPGGLAYSRNGNYLCVFFGQDPAWPVDHIGQITGDTWAALCKDNTLNSLTISA